MKFATLLVFTAALAFANALVVPPHHQRETKLSGGEIDVFVSGTGRRDAHDHEEFPTRGLNEGTEPKAKPETFTSGGGKRLEEEEDLPIRSLNEKTTFKPETFSSGGGKRFASGDAERLRLPRHVADSGRDSYPKRRMLDRVPLRAFAPAKKTFREVARADAEPEPVKRGSF